MKKIIKCLLVILIALILPISSNIVDESNALTIYETDTNTPQSGNSMVLLDGYFYTESATTILNRINQIRKEACDQRLYNPNTDTNLKPSDYVPLKWSKEAEAYARIRAAEQTFLWAHTRPNGNSCFSTGSYNNIFVGFMGENLEWNMQSFMYGIEHFYSEKADLLKGNYDDAGHYLNMIDPDFTHVGVGGFRADGDSRIYVAMELISSTNSSANKNSFSGLASQRLEIKQSYIKSISISGNKGVALNGTTKLLLYGNSENNPGTNNGSGTKTKYVIETGAKWSSSDATIAKVNNKGVVTGLKAGKVTIKATINNKTASFNIEVVKVDKPKLVAIYNSAKGADIRFKPVNGINEYVIMRKENGVWSAIKYVKASELEKAGANYKYIDETIKNNYGKGYIYSVAAKKNGAESMYDTVGLAIYRLKAPTIKSIVANGNGKVTLTWSKETCHGYEIQYSSDNGTNWLKYPEIKDPNKTTITINNLDKNKTYVFRIRCQKTNPDRGVGWSQYSPWKSITVK